MNARAPIPPIDVQKIEAARERLRGIAVDTPLIPLPLDFEGAPEVWLKVECVQPIGSFKIRGAANAIAQADPKRLRDGVYTASAGNMAQGVAYVARALAIPCRVIVPEGAPAAKREAIERLGATAVPVPFDRWWGALEHHGFPGEDGFFVHPVADPHVIAGNGTIGLEIAEAISDVKTVFVPFGGGGLSCGIASALRSVAPDVRTVACEVDTAAPLRASLEAGEPRSIERIPTFVDGIGGSAVLTDMWPLASTVLSGVEVVSIEQICDAIRLLVSSANIVAEGAGGSSVAAALQSAGPGERVVAVISGGNIDTPVLADILSGGSGR